MTKEELQKALDVANNALEANQKRVQELEAENKKVIENDDFSKKRYHEISERNYILTGQVAQLQKALEEEQAKNAQNAQAIDDAVEAGAAYPHRNILFLLMAIFMQKNDELQKAIINLKPHLTAVKPKQKLYWWTDNEKEGPVQSGWFVVGIDEKISYHLPVELLPIAKKHFEYIEQSLWDGHTAHQVEQTLKEILKGL